MSPFLSIAYKRVYHRVYHPSRKYTHNSSLAELRTDKLNVSRCNPTHVCIAARPVSPVSTRPLFPLPVGCPASPINAVGRRRPTLGPKIMRGCCEGCGLRTVGKPKPVLFDAIGRKGRIRTCETLLCSLREVSYWFINGPRSHLIPSIPKIFWEACPHADPPSCSVLTHALRP